MPGGRDEAVLPAFGGDRLNDPLCGRRSEGPYQEQVGARQGWAIPLAHLKHFVRSNFHRRVPGMAAVLDRLAAGSELVLLSERAVEWADQVRSIHPFLQTFNAQTVSFELKQIKRDPSTLRRVLERLGRAPSRCLFADDSEANIATAAVAGLRGIRFRTAPRLMQYPAALGAWAGD